MNARINSLIAGLLYLVLGAQFSTALAQGSLTPPGAPAPTMKSLAQIEPRTPISTAPFTITNPGSYYVTANLTVSGGSAITISTSGVFLDLGGFCLSSTAASANGSAVMLGGGLRNVTIQNGTVESGVTTNSSGVYAGSGFMFGITYNGDAPVNVRVSGVSVAGVLYHGIYLGSGDSTVIESCTVRMAGGDGLMGSTIRNCVALYCGGPAIYGDQVTECRGASSLGYGILSAYSVQNSCGSSGSNIGIYTSTVENCYGSSNSSWGIYATVAENCCGFSYGSTYGLYASTSASGCYGYSTSGTGLCTFIANVCHGGTSSGTAMSVTHNINSF